MPYKSKELVEKIQKAYYDINLDVCKIQEGGIRALSTKQLTEQEKADKTFDFLGGLEIIDNDFRMFIIEGLGAGSMKRLEELVPRSEPNTSKTKILKNSEVLFENRLYQEFNLDIKRIRLREKLSQILLKPNIYIRTKVPENIFKVLAQIQEIRNCENVT